MVTRKSLALEQDFIPALSFSGWAVEAGQQEMDVGCQGPHDSDFGLKGSDNGSHEFGGMVINIKKRWQGRVGMFDEMAGDGFGSPLGQERLDEICCPGRLETQGVTAQICRLSRGFFIGRFG